MDEFRQREEFKRGRNGETLVAERLRRSGWYTIPSYDYSGEDGNKAPRLEGLRSLHVVPDIDAAKDGRRIWVEVKTKKTASFMRITGRLEHGISRRHWLDYLEVQRITGCPVWLAIYEENTGDMLVQSIDRLPQPRESRMSKNGRDEGVMVYFAREWFVTARRF